MYARMIDVGDNCAICLEPCLTSNNSSNGMQVDVMPSYSLSDKFGCGCKQKVHEDCLRVWVLRSAEENERNTAYCIVCRQEVCIGDINTREQVSEEVNVDMYNNETGLSRNRVGNGRFTDNEKRKLCLMITAFIVVVMLFISILSVFNKLQ